MSIGTASTIGAIAAHDLVHSLNRLDALSAGIFTATIMNMHSPTYHVDGHHVEVATARSSSLMANTLNPYLGFMHQLHSQSSLQNPICGYLTIQSADSKSVTIECWSTKRTTCHIPSFIFWFWLAVIFHWVGASPANYQVIPLFGNSWFHKQVGTPADASYARLGVDVYQYLLGSLYGIVVGAVKLERRRLERLGLPFVCFQNRWTE